MRGRFPGHVTTSVSKTTFYGVFSLISYVYLNIFNEVQVAFHLHESSSSTSKFIIMQIAFTLVRVHEIYTKFVHCSEYRDYLAM